MCCRRSAERKQSEVALIKPPSTKRLRSLIAGAAEDDLSDDEDGAGAAPLQLLGMPSEGRGDDAPPR